jgi:hypothetical protein
MVNFLSFANEKATTKKLRLVKNETRGETKTPPAEQAKNCEKRKQTNKQKKKQLPSRAEVFHSFLFTFALKFLFYFLMPKPAGRKKTLSGKQRKQRNSRLS